MARVKRTLTAALRGLIGGLFGGVLLAGMTVFGPRYAQAEPAGPARLYLAPTIVDGKAFPVLLPADGRWLWWIDTYGAPRMRLIDGVWKQVGKHEGIDIFAERSSPVVAIEKGVVENAGWTFYGGYRVGVRGDDGRYYFYAHLLADLAPGISKGSRVGVGQRLGSLGNSGYGPEGTIDEFPPHLHFGLQDGATWLNSQALLRHLYEAAVQQARSDEARMHDIDVQQRALLARSSAPAPPPAQAIAAQIIRLETEGSAISARRTLRP